jgi:arginase
MGSVAAVADAARRDGGRLGVVWLDAHGDMNSGSTSPSGNVHGMPLAALLGDGPDMLTKIGDRHPALAPNEVALIGIRAIDRREADAIRAMGVHAFTMRDIDGSGIGAAIRSAVAALKEAGCTSLHVSFDVDFIDPSIAPGVGTRVRGGPTYRESHFVMELLADTGMVTSADVVELNPCLDRENATARLSVELVASLFGKRIL